MSDSNPCLDLRQDHLAIVGDILHRHVPDRRVVAFGSRANWTAKPYSDLDLAILGDEPLPLGASAALAESFVESDLPFKVDLVDWASVDERFRDMILRDGMIMQAPGKQIEREHVAAERLMSCRDWHKVAIGEIADIFGGGTPSTKKAENFDGVIPWLTPKDLSGIHDRYMECGERNLSQQGLNSSSAKLLPAGSVLLSTRAPIGYVALAKNPIATNQGFRSLVVRDGVFSEYLYYWLRLNTEELERHASGSTFRELSGSSLKNIELFLPPLPEQRAIAHILGTLDDRIELNRRMNETLEAMARAIFQDWFVDFGPVKAKMESRDPYLPPEIWGLFPDALDDESKPAGWQTSNIGTEVNVVGGSTPSTKNPAYWEKGNHHWATPKDLSKLVSPVLLDTERKVTDAGIKKISSGLLPVGTVLLSSRAPIGYLAITSVRTAVNQGFIAMVCKKRLPNIFVLFWCYENIGYIKDISGGSTFSEISKGAFRPLPVVVPAEPALAAFEVIVRPLYDRIVANDKETQLLSHSRDLLLPKLISGRIRLRDAERLIGEATKPSSVGASGYGASS